MVVGQNPRISGQPSSLSCLKKSTIKDDPNIILKEDEKLISDQNIVREKMNDFYVNIAQNIGINSTLKVNDEHPSIKKIKEQNLNKKL